MTLSDPWSAAVARLAPAAAALGLLVDDRLARRAHAASALPIWSNGRRPNFWPDLDVRLLLTAMHRQMTLAQSLDVVARLLGAERAPSRSAVHRYWQALDRAAAL